MKKKRHLQRERRHPLRYTKFTVVNKDGKCVDEEEEEKCLLFPLGKNLLDGEENPATFWYKRS